MIQQHRKNIEEQGSNNKGEKFFGDGRIEIPTIYSEKQTLFK